MGPRTFAWCSWSCAHIIYTGFHLESIVLRFLLWEWNAGLDPLQILVLSSWKGESLAR